MVYPIIRNGLYSGASFAAQWDDNLLFDSYPADDFYIRETTVISGVRWVGCYYSMYWDKDNYKNWNISFLTNNEETNRPNGHPLTGVTYSGPFSISANKYSREYMYSSESGSYYKIFYKFESTFSSLTFEPGRYWISIYGYHHYPPQSGWGRSELHYPYNDNTMHLRSDYWKIYHWSSGIVRISLNDTDLNKDTSFELLGNKENILYNNYTNFDGSSNIISDVNFKESNKSIYYDPLGH